MGHIISGRNEALSVLGNPALWSEEELAIYKTGSSPITSSGQGLILNKLLADLDESLEQLSACLAQITPEELGRIVETRFGERPLDQHLASLHWHETYHTGQLEILRELALTG